VNAYTLPINCLHYGGALRHVNEAAPTGTQAVAVAKCGHCDREWLIAVQMRALTSVESRRRERHRSLRTQLEPA